MKHTIQIEIPANFDFRATVYSHGWSELRPFSLDEDNWKLSYVFSDDGQVVPGVISVTDGRLNIDLESAAIPTEKIVADTRHILRLNDDLGEFYSAVAAHENLGWIVAKRAGRLIRSPTVWEDLVKTICTTNCSWGLTKLMIANLVEKLGQSGSTGSVMSEPSALAGGTGACRGQLGSNEVAMATVDPTANAGGSELRAFPTADAMAAMDENFYRTEIRAGYRSPYFVELAEAVASGNLDPQSWLTSDLPTDELKKEMKKVKGVGDYAAENLLKLVGRYDGLALDSFLRSQFYKTHNKEKACPDKKIERHYKKYGKWRGLVMWCDMTERWSELF